VTVVTALNPIIGYENSARIAKHALSNGSTIADAAQALGILSRDEVAAFLVPERLTQPALSSDTPSRGISGLN
jgi:aspartate ammonia-lyase